MVPLKKNNNNKKNRTSLVLWLPFSGSKTVKRALRVFPGLLSSRIRSGHPSSSAAWVWGLRVFHLLSSSTQIAHWLVDALGRPGGLFWFSAWTKQTPCYEELAEIKTENTLAAPFALLPLQALSSVWSRKILRKLADPLQNEGMDLLKHEIVAFLSFLKGQNM